MVIYIIRKDQLLKSTTFLLILNMACGDLVTTTVTSPPLIKFLFVGLAWIPGTFGGLLCKLNLYLVSVTFLGCIFSLVGIQIDRFLAVIRPLRHLPWRKWTKVIIPAIWLAAILLPINMWHEIGGKSYSSSGLNISVCYEEQVPLSMGITLGICFLLPFTVMLILYPIIIYHLWTRQVPGEPSALQQQRAIVRHGKSPKWWLLLYFLSFSVGHRNLFSSGYILWLDRRQTLYPSGYFHLSFGYKCLTLPWILFSMRSLTNLSDLASRKLYVVVFYGDATRKSCKVHIKTFIKGIRIQFKT